VSQEIEPVYRIVVQEGKLMLTRLKHKPAQLEPTILDVFTAEIGTIRFTRNSRHSVSGFVLARHLVPLTNSKVISISLWRN
jgi:hypothetical protein